jgi:hypothetical protein
LASKNKPHKFKIECATRIDQASTANGVPARRTRSLPGVVGECFRSSALKYCEIVADAILRVSSYDIDLEALRAKGFTNVAENQAGILNS